MTTDNTQLRVDGGSPGELENDDKNRNGLKARNSRERMISREVCLPVFRAVQ